MTSGGPATVRPKRWGEAQEAAGRGRYGSQHVRGSDDRPQVSAAPQPDRDARDLAGHPAEPAGLRRAIREITDPTAVMRQVVDQALLLIESAEGAAVELEHDGHLTYVCTAGSLAPYLGIRLRADGSLSGAAVRSGEVLRCDDSEHDDRVDRDACRRVGAVSMVCVPLRHDERPIGVLKVSSSRPHSFDDADVAELTALARFISTVISAASEVAHAAGQLVAEAGEPEPVPGLPHDGRSVSGVRAFMANVLRPGLVDDLETRSRVERAISGSGLSIVCQPIVDLHTGELVGAEALARFGGPPAQPPDRWFADAQRVGLLEELELAAVRRALELIDRLPEHAYLAVNVSHEAVASRELPGLLEDAGAERVVLELTEQLEADDHARLRELLDGLRSRGTRLAIDDSGAGYSGLARIVGLAPDLIKLDRVMTRGVDLDPVRRSLAGALVTFAGDTGAAVVAEGIETAAELETVRRLGIRFGQGYYLARPASVESLPRRVELGSSPGARPADQPAFKER